MDLSISIINWNTRDVLADCLESIYNTTGSSLDFEVIVVDNASSDGSAEMVREKYPQVLLMPNDCNLGFAVANNQAYALSAGRHFLLLNPDTVCLPGALARLVGFLDENSEVGAVGPLVLNPDRTLQYSWARFPTVMGEALGKLDRSIEGSSQRGGRTADEIRNLGPFACDWIGGACMVVRREAAEEAGVMDESLFMYSEETDWCFRLRRAGWQVWVCPEAEIVHLGGQGSSQVPVETALRLAESKLRVFRKHKGMMQAMLLRLLLIARSAAGVATWPLRRDPDSRTAARQRHMALLRHLVIGSKS